MKPKLIKGGSHSDDRGSIQFNNDFNSIDIKRIYTIENKSPEFIRAWQGHSIERRWFSAIKGSFDIKLIQIDNKENPNKNAKVYTFILKNEKLDILCVPSGYVSSIQALEENSKLLAMSDYLLGEVKDELRFEPNYFTTKELK
ncbi:cupin domain-containing protein [Arenibacter amylolyticus]|uniref:WxcM-like domain-containing protein n=1 Tax=Arenibacter amylolyticus TaxID=1406873 RepID=UPI000A3CF2BA|nr:WxcM-like domain-containing protein [Arenibacter amylolyticus]